ncbi:MAG: pirin family protein [Pyrinomonadaceae bacterium]
MIKVRLAGERGKTQTHWLDGSHTFSFNRYYDPRWTGFRDLLVINEDYIAPAKGFGTHSHSDMEIITYVIEGALEHRDSTGASGVVRPGEVQKMSAGTGVSHSEVNASATERTHLLQIWIKPERAGIKPYYEQRTFPDAEKRGRLRLVAAPGGGGDDSLTVQQDVKLYDASLSAGEQVSYQLGDKRHAWVQVIKGAVVINGTPLRAGDGAAISEEFSLNLEAREAAEFMLFNLA